MTSPASPCSRICRIDPWIGWCLGCRRTLEEISTWSKLPPKEEHKVLAKLRGRGSSPHN
ncbi:DUF1289 domain-containing protein [Novosphingobium sp.]|uniref:DUF1289 domain-containing protein n=1 Tax=Novosphingobium sp. TaxID=1874826 RepID=UPI002B47833E|nr:DUF1289 domain-containing protein [Novosphingobium sp.]HKR90973.1 DUF1289 domain-containing protein [Novosphingobium sp.]